MGDTGTILGSGTYDEADERSDLMLLVPVVLIEGSELADDAMPSGEDTKAEYPEVNGSPFGDVLSGKDKVFESVGTKLGAGAGLGRGPSDKVFGPGVAGGGSSPDVGRLVLM